MLGGTVWACRSRGFKPDEEAIGIVTTTRQECVRALRKAAVELGRSPTKAEYEALDLRPSSASIRYVMGGWNAAKDAAGLETYAQGAGGSTRIQAKPDDVELPDGYVWEELNPQQRWYYKNREHRVAVKTRRKNRLREWLTEYKREKCHCSRCGEGHPACLDFHHTGEKRMGVSAMVTLGYAKETILEEIQACEILCANCHRKEHHNHGIAHNESDKN